MAKRGAPILGTVAISGNTLVAVDFSGNVYPKSVIRGCYFVVVNVIYR